MFWEFFSFELKFRLKSISTYVYFALWFFLSFLSIAAEDFINVGNDKVLLNGPFSSAILYILFTFLALSSSQRSLEHLSFETFNATRINFFSRNQLRSLRISVVVGLAPLSPLCCVSAV